jgi:anti-anti-sigma factor
MGSLERARVAVESGPRPETLLVRAVGELDLHARPELDAAIDQALGRAPQLIAIDLRAVEFIDSAALAGIVFGLRRCGEQGVRGVIIRGGPGQVARLIELTGMETLAEFIDADDLPALTAQIA